MARLAQDKTTTQKATFGLGGDMDLTDLAEAAFSEATQAELDAARPLAVVTTAAVVIDSDSSAGGNGVGATPAATSLTKAVAVGTYVVDIEVVVTSSTNGGVELSFTVPTDSTFTWQGEVLDSSGAGVYFVAGTASSALNHIASALTTDPVRIRGVLTNTSAGTFTVLAAQDTGHADNTTIHIGSRMVLTPVV